MIKKIKNLQEYNNNKVSTRICFMLREDKMLVKYYDNLVLS